MLTPEQVEKRMDLIDTVMFALEDANIEVIACSWENDGQLSVMLKHEAQRESAKAIYVPLMEQTE